MEKGSYFIFDEELWEEGGCFDCRIEQDALSILGEEKGKRGVYLCCCLDSKEKETIWHRMQIWYKKTGQGSIAISYFATDDLELTIGTNKINLYSFAKEKNYSLQQKLYLLESFWQETVKSPEDILLFQAKGQYFYFKIELLAYEGCEIQINHLRIDFPRKSITSYLPAFYDSDHKSNDFLKRFLSVFHTMLFDLQENIEKVSKCFMPSVASEPFLHWLGEYMSVSESIFWKEEIARMFLENSFLFYQTKGTKQCIFNLVKLYTGESPFIIENYEILENCLHKPWEKEYTALYGKDIYTYFIFVEEQYLSDYRQYEELKKLLEAFQPAHTIGELIVLRPYIVFGQHCYMGINSCLLSSTALELYDASTIPFQTTLLE